MPIRGGAGGEQGFFPPLQTRRKKMAGGTAIYAHATASWEEGYYIKPRMPSTIHLGPGGLGLERVTDANADDEQWRLLRFVSFRLVSSRLVSSRLAFPFRQPPPPPPSFTKRQGGIGLPVFSSLFFLLLLLLLLFPPPFPSRSIHTHTFSDLTAAHAIPTAVAAVRMDWEERRRTTQTGEGYECVSMSPPPLPPPPRRGRRPQRPLCFRSSFFSLCGAAV